MPSANPDGLAHTGEVILDSNTGKPKPHISSVDCWCLPIRHRFNSLSQKWEAWDRDNLEWELMDPQPGGAPLDTLTGEGENEVIADEPVKITGAFTKLARGFDLEGDEADREAGRVENDATKRF